MISTATTKPDSVSSFPFYKPDDENSLIYHPNVNKKEGFQAIKSCTLPKIIEKLTSAVNFDKYFASAFFLTYRDFTTPLEVVNLLVLRYGGPPQGSCKDYLRLFEIEVDVVQENVISVIRQMISTLLVEDFNNSELHDAIQEFFNSLPEDIKNELFMIYFKTRKAVKPPTTTNTVTTNGMNSGGSGGSGGGSGGYSKQITGSAASTMRFSFSVSPKTQSPSSTNGVLTGLLQQQQSSPILNNNIAMNDYSSNGGNSGSNTPIYGSKSMKLGKGIMSKILQSGGNISSIPELSATAGGGSNNNSATNSPNINNGGSSKENLLNGSIINNNNNSSANNNEDFEQNSDRPAFVPEIIARELTIMEWELITSLTLTEFTQKSYKENRGAINIANLTTWFNRISSWVTTKIISKETPEERATIIEAFITIANYAKELKNYNCVMEIMGSLHNSAISRLKNSWALVSAKGNEIFQQLNTLMSPDINFKNYRKQLTLIQPNEPCIPYLGLFLTDFIYLDESNPCFAVLHPHMVNLERIFLIGTRVQEFFKLFTNCQYSFVSNPQVREAILSEKVWDENETFRLSRIREEGTSNSNSSSISSSSTSSNSPSNSHHHHHHAQKDTLTASTTNSNSITNSNSLSSSSLSSSSHSSSTTNTRRKNFVQKYRMSFTGNDPPPSIASFLSERDWKVITTNSKVIKFKKDQKIIAFGDLNNSLYRIQSGRVKVEPFCINKFNQQQQQNSDSSTPSSRLSTASATSDQNNAVSEDSSPNGLSKSMNLEIQQNNNNNNNTIDYQYLEEGDIFGEEAFLYEKPSLLTIISDTDDLELIQIEKTFILQLFSSEPILSATFYKYIAVLMAERLKIIYANFHPSGSVQGVGTFPLISAVGGGGGLSQSTTNTNGLRNSTSSPTLSKMNMDYSKRRSTIYETPTSLDAIRDGNDYKFRSTFGLSNQEEVIIKSYQCKHNNINGILYITKYHLCFEGKFLKIHKQKSTPFSSVTKILPLIDKNTISVATKDKVKKFTFKANEDLSEALGLITNIWKNHHIDGSKSSSQNSSPISKAVLIASANNSSNPNPSNTVTSVPSAPIPPKSPKVGRGESFSNITDLPTKEEWNLILKGAKSLTFKKGDILMSEGVEYQKIFQIVKGECSIVKSIITTNNIINNALQLQQQNLNGVTIVSSSSTTSSPESGGAEIPSPQSLVDPKNSITISKLSQGSIYGEMTFLLSGGCSTSLVVTSDEVEVFILESYFLNIMLKSKPQLAPKFYKYLACVLESRVKQYRQQILYI